MLLAYILSHEYMTNGHQRVYFRKIQSMFVSDPMYDVASDPVYDGRNYCSPMSARTRKILSLVAAVSSK